MTHKLLPLLFLLPALPLAAQPNAYSAAGRAAQVFTTAQGTTLRLSAEPAALPFRPAGQPPETQACVFIDPDHAFQTVLGIGGAITDAAAETFAKLPAARQQEFLQAYYSPTAGLGYSLARTTIGSSDFSSASYTYLADQDSSLRSFSVAPDERYRIPLLKRAVAMAGGRLPLLATPWSPPAWMKTNRDLLRGGALLPRFRQRWADYFVRFIRAYEQRGLPVWGVSTQNEPMATQSWESCVYSGEAERDFIRDYLGPTLAQNQLGGRKIIAWDHNRDLLYQRASTVLDDPAAARYVWGVGYHWYETWTGSGMLFDNVRRVREAYPATNLLLTEACVEKFSFDRLGDWQLGEKYGYSMLNDFNAGAVGWLDWNVLLDQTGGPNHVGNFCFAPIIADTRTGQLIYTNAYHYIGHFARFVRPGARRVVASSNRDWLSTTAFRNPDGRLAVVVLNLSDKKQEFQLWVRGQAAAALSLPHSISTYVF